MKFIDLTEKRFGKLTVIKRVENDKNGRTRWLCKCDCGKEIIVLSNNLRKGYTKSCGCYHNEMMKSNEYAKIEYGLSTKKQIFYNYKRTAKVRGINFDLSFDQFVHLTKKNCWYCDIEPSNTCKGNGNGDFIYNGIDRVDNTKGYTVDNCVSCCDQCNWSKKDLSQKEFMNWIKKVFEHRIKND